MAEESPKFEQISGSKRDLIDKGDTNASTTHPDETADNGLCVPPNKKGKFGEENVGQDNSNLCQIDVADGDDTNSQNEDSVTQSIQGEDGTNEDDSSEISGISDLMDEGESQWRPMAGPISWVQQQMMAGKDPRELLSCMIGESSNSLSEDLDTFQLWKLIIELISEPPKRKKLDHINTLEDVVKLIVESKKIIVLTGAGVSVSCGIPDFRSRDGIYSRLAVEYPDLPNPQAMFDIHYFSHNPRPFFKFAKEIYPGQFQPSLSHKFIKLIEDHGKLLRNYTQNIDTLEQVAGITKIIQCHGSFATATCGNCKHKVNSDSVKEDIMNQVIPQCPMCPAGTENSIMKPDIVFFGESLSTEFHNQMEVDKDECDLLIVIGSSLKVRPVALIPNSLPQTVPQILINRETLKHLSFDVELIGDGDTIVSELCKRLAFQDEGWELNGVDKELTKQITREELLSESEVDGDAGSLASDALDESKSGVPVSDTTSKPQPSPPVLNNEVRNAAEHKNTKTEQTKCLLDSQNSSQSSVSCSDKFQTISTSDSLDICNVKSSCLDCGNHDNKTDDVKIDSGTNSSKSKAESSELSNENLCMDAKDQTPSGTDRGLAGEEHSPGHSSAENDDTGDKVAWNNRWHHYRHNLAARLPEGSHLFVPPNRYIFRGAEYSELQDDDVMSDSSSSIISSLDNKEDDLDSVNPIETDNSESHSKKNAELTSSGNADCVSENSNDNFKQNILTDIRDLRRESGIESGCESETIVPSVGQESLGEESR